MNPERWQQIQDILAELEELTPEERTAHLDRRCASDPELRREVESLQAAAEEAETYFDGLVDRAIVPMAGLEKPPPPVSLTGMEIEHFLVLDKLGEGGMGEVYRARDRKLQRDVALKILPQRFADAPERVARFRREAQLLASLNHPGIAAIYGLHEHAGRLILVLELVEGPTLSARLESGPLAVSEALEIARQMAEALEAAHALGIVHRDLKPSNVKLTADGKVKILDFGIATTTRMETGSSGDRSPDTAEILAANTHTGEIFGTVSYMSPEQLKSKRVDTRSDVWAFGALLFQMLAGRRAFQAEGFALTLTRILEHDPAWEALPATLSPRVHTLLQRCLEKTVNRRLQAIGEARILLEDEIAGVPESLALPTEGTQPAGLSRSPWAAVVVAAALAVGVVAGSRLVRPAPPAPVERFVSPLRAGQEPVLFGGAAFNLSPDGSVLVYRGPGEGGTGNRLWIRRWDELDATPLAGTEGALAPSVSPDGRRLAFSQNGEIRVAALTGGPARAVMQGINPTWGPDGLLYATTPEGTARIDPGGGDPEVVTRRGPGEGNHFIIDYLPDGATALVSAQLEDGRPEIFTASLATGEMSPLAEGTWPRYAESGHLVFLMDGSLMAAPFDVGDARLTGPATPLVQGVLSYALSDDGTLLYATGAGEGGVESELVWMSRSGEITPVEDGWYFDRGGANPGWSLSPDGTRVALRIGSEAGQDIWVKNLRTGTLSRLTFHEAEDRKPRWSVDGRTVLFLSARGDDMDVWTRPADGTGEPTLLYDHPTRIAEASWSPDGEWLLFRTAGVQDLPGRRDVLAVRPGTEAEPVPFLTGDYDETGPAISPDGRWLVYSSTETGRHELYVRPFPDVSAGRWQLTTEGGSAAVWAHTRNELYYIDAGRRLRVIRYETDPGFHVMSAETLFTIPAGFDVAQVAPLYDVTPDDQRFLMGRTYASGEGPGRRAPELVLVRNYYQELREVAR